MEILIQKLDHSGIAMFAAGVNIPVSFVLLKYNYQYFNNNSYYYDVINIMVYIMNNIGMVLLIASVGYCFFIIYNIFMLKVL